MSKLNLLAAALLVTTACSASDPSTSPPSPHPGKAPTGAPRTSKGRLPMLASAAGGKKPKTVSAVREMAGKPVVGTRADVSATGDFALVLDVGVRFMLIVTLEDGTMISLGAQDSHATYLPWLPIGNSLDGDIGLDFGTVIIVDNRFVSTTVLLDIDWDEDGIADFDDDDDDNDGIADADDLDIDNDGVEDDYLDADGDGLVDLADSDDDNDGVDDAVDTDDDGDGIDDSEDDDDGDIDGDGQPDDGDGEPDDDDDDGDGGR